MFTEEYGFLTITQDNGICVYMNDDLRRCLTKEELYEFIELCRDCGYQYAINKFNSDIYKL